MNQLTSNYCHTAADTTFVDQDTFTIWFAIKSLYIKVYNNGSQINFIECKMIFKVACMVKIKLFFYGLILL